MDKKKRKIYKAKRISQFCYECPKCKTLISVE